MTLKKYQSFLFQIELIEIKIWKSPLCFLIHHFVCSFIRVTISVPFIPIVGIFFDVLFCDWLLFFLAYVGAKFLWERQPTTKWFCRLAIKSRTIVPECLL